MGRSLFLGGTMFVAVLASGCPRSNAQGRTDDGRELFASVCSRCHGPEGGGGLPLFDGGPSPANFRTHAFHAERTDEQIRRTIVQGKGTGMPAFGTTFNDAQLTSLVAHVRSLDPDRTK